MCRFESSDKILQDFFMVDALSVHTAKHQSWPQAVIVSFTTLAKNAPVWCSVVYSVLNNRGSGIVTTTLTIGSYLQVYKLIDKKLYVLSVQSISLITWLSIRLYFWSNNLVDNAVLLSEWMDGLNALKNSIKYKFSTREKGAPENKIVRVSNSYSLFWKK